MAGYRPIRLIRPQTVGGSTVINPADAVVRWGPDFGGVDGDRYTAEFDSQLTAIALAGVLPMDIATQLTALMVDYEAATLLLSTANPSNKFSFLPNELELDNFISDLQIGGFELDLNISTDINSVKYLATTAGTFNLTAPTNADEAIVELWGAGGGTTLGTLVTGHGGGGGGEYARANAYAITGGATYPLTVGAGGAYATPTTAGGASTFDTTGVVANGGQPGVAGTVLGQGAGGAGGTNGTGDVTFDGGDGGGSGGVLIIGGGGGGSGGDSAAGDNAAGRIGGAGGVDGGGDGADGGDLLIGQNATVAEAPGGGGGGRGTTNNGSGGADGQACVTFTV